MTRVVVTGMNAVSPLGNSWNEVYSGLINGDCGIRFMDEWSDIQGLDSYLGAPVMLEDCERIPAKVKRSMGRVSLIAAQTATKAMAMSGLMESGCYDPANIGIAYGSSFGSHPPLVPFGRILSERQVRGVSPTAYIQIMGHTTGVNLSLLFEIRGRLIPVSAACASGGLALGYGCETIRQGIHPVMVVGSADELSPAPVAVFDSFYAASRENSSPSRAVRPFSIDRSGMVVGEGGATFILESLDHARHRGARIYAEVVGFATNMDGSHVLRQNVHMMSQVMEKALASANLQPGQIGYINAHASGVSADEDEALAIRHVFGEKVPVSSSKGHIGHLLGGCGSVEAWMTINMMNQGWFAPTLNLDTARDDCSGLAHIQASGLQSQCEYVMSNNFAFGGVNVSVIFQRYT